MNIVFAGERKGYEEPEMVASFNQLDSLRAL